MSPRLVSPSKAERTCPDCPAELTGLLLGLVRDCSPKRCPMVVQPVEARHTLPSVWAERHPFAIVRRGWVMRFRADGRGNQTAVDVAGSGALVPLRSSSAPRDRRRCASPASRTLLCFCPEGDVAPSRGDASTAYDLVQLHREALERVERIADARGREGARAKVAALLATLADLRTDASPTPGRLPEGLQQRDIAALLQIRPETVCRALRALEASSPSVS